MTVVRGHRSRPGVGGPLDAMPITSLRIRPQFADSPVQAKRPLTRFVRDLLCRDCSWPLVCGRDRTCWHEEADA